MVRVVDELVNMHNKARWYMSINKDISQLIRAEISTQYKYTKAVGVE